MRGLSRNSVIAAAAGTDRATSAAPRYHRRTTQARTSAVTVTHTATAPAATARPAGDSSGVAPRRLAPVSFPPESVAVHPSHAKAGGGGLRPGPTPGGGRYRPSGPGTARGFRAALAEMVGAFSSCDSPFQARLIRWAATTSTLGLRASSHHCPVTATIPTSIWAYIGASFGS